MNGHGQNMRAEGHTDVWFGYLGETLALVCGADTFEEALAYGRETLLEMIDCPIEVKPEVRQRWQAAYARWERK